MEISVAFVADKPKTRTSTEFLLPQNEKKVWQKCGREPQKCGTGQKSLNINLVKIDIMIDKNTLKEAYSLGFNSFVAARNGTGVFSPSVCLNSFFAEVFFNQLQQPPATDEEFKKIYRSTYELHLSALDNGNNYSAWLHLYNSACILNAQYNGKAEALLTAMYSFLYYDTKTE